MHADVCSILMTSPQSEGRSITGRINQENFVHTAPEGYGTVGMSQEHVDAGVAKLQQQRQAILRESDAGTGVYTEDEWAILQESGLPLDILKRDTCPFWITEGARNYIDQTLAKQNRGNTTRSRWCICS